MQTVILVFRNVWLVNLGGSAPVEEITCPLLDMYGLSFIFEEGCCFFGILITPLGGCCSLHFVK